MELRQVILKYFKDGADPVGIPGPTAIVVGASHCRLSNIDEKGCWIRTEEFWLGSTHVVHVEGTAAKGRLAGWMQMRRQFPELFEGPQAFEVYGQPAAVVDNIIAAWQLEALSEQFPGGILQRDMLGSYRSSSSQATMQALNWIDSPILGTMTPVLQLTDTDLARRLKVHAEQETDHLRQLLKLKAMKEGVRPSFVMKVPEVWRIVSRTAQWDQHRHHHHHHFLVLYDLLGFCLIRNIKHRIEYK